VDKPDFIMNEMIATIRASLGKKIGTMSLSCASSRAQAEGPQRLSRASAFT
jgi:hypothetical protein